LEEARVLKVKLFTTVIIISILIVAFYLYWKPDRPTDISKEDWNKVMNVYFLIQKNKVMDWSEKDIKKLWKNMNELNSLEQSEKLAEIIDLLDKVHTYQSSCEEFGEGIEKYENKFGETSFSSGCTEYQEAMNQLDNSLILGACHSSNNLVSQYVSQMLV
jgi:hypothetical protein